jgi:hypothetical protein
VKHQLWADLIVPVMDIGHSFSNEASDLIKVRRAFPATPVGRFVEKNRISYWFNRAGNVGGTWFPTAGLPNNPAIRNVNYSTRICFNVTDEEDVLLRLGLAGMLTFT